MISKAFLLLAFLLSLSTVQTNRPCNLDEVCLNNYDFIWKRRERDDYSVHKDSYYIFIKPKTFDDLVTLKGLEYNRVFHKAKEFTPNRIGSINHLDQDGDSEFKKQALLDSLSTSLGTEKDIVYTRRNNYFVVYGIIDLINFQYTKEFYNEQTNPVVYYFSAQEIIDNLPEDRLNDIGEVIAYIDQNGLCLDEDYKNGYCSKKFYVESFQKINEFTNQGLYDVLREDPLYVQVGLDPLYFQFHEPGCEHAIHAGYGRPTYAGVLTGLQIPLLDGNEFTDSKYTPDGHEYWQMYIRRHGNGYNYVRMNCTFMKLDKTTEEWEWNQPFAGLSSKVYRVVVPKSLPTEGLVVSSQEVLNNNQLIEAIETALENAGTDVDSSTITIDGSSIDCGKHFYNLTSINGISTFFIDKHCVIDTTASIIYTGDNRRRLEEATGDKTPIELNFVGLSVKGISFTDDIFKEDLFKIRIENCLAMRSLHIGDNSLLNTQSLSIRNNPNLLSISIGENALSFLEDTESNYFRNCEFIMSDLPVLQKLAFGDGCMKNFKIVSVDNVEASDDLDMQGGEAFARLLEYNYDVKDVHVDINNYFLGVKNLPPPIQYDEKFRFCTGNIIVKPVNTEISGCSINPIPDESKGLYFDSDTCVLSGTMNEPFTKDYTISYINDSTQSDTFTLDVQTCLPLEFEKSEYYYFFYDSIQIQPKTTMSECTISPDPSEYGLKFSDSCQLTGVINTKLTTPTVFMVMGVADDKLYVGSFTLILNNRVCAEGSSPITLTIDGLDESSGLDISWNLYQGKGTTGTLEKQQEKITVKYSVVSYDYCLPHNIYTFKFSHGCSKDLTGGYLSVNGGEMKFDLFRFMPLSGASAEFIVSFSSYLPFQVGYSTWKWLKTDSIADGWNTLNFDDSTWSESKPAAIGDSNTIVTYIRKTFAIDDVDSYHVLNVRVIYAGGLVAYFNGKKVARFNLIENFDETTYADQYFEGGKFSKFHIILSEEGVVEGNNVIAFELHAATADATAVVFDATGVFGVNDCSIAMDSVVDVTGEKFGTNSNQWTMTSFNDFFDYMLTGFSSIALEVGQSLQWTVENREGSKFNSFAIGTLSSGVSWRFKLEGYEVSDDNYKQLYNTSQDGTSEGESAAVVATAILPGDSDIASLKNKRTEIDAPNGMTPYNKFRYEVVQLQKNVRGNEFLFQYCKPSSSTSE